MTDERQYRIVPAEKAGYTPGLHVVQYHDREAGVWFDIGDPKPEAEAKAQVRALREPRWVLTKPAHGLAPQVWWHDLHGFITERADATVFDDKGRAEFRPKPMFSEWAEA